MLQVSDSGARSWLFRYKVAGKIKSMGLGSVKAVSLATARKKAQDARAMRAEGTDPLGEKKASKEADKAEVEAKAAQAQDAAAVEADDAPDLFKNVAASFLADNRAQWKNAKHRQQWENTLGVYVFPAIGSKICRDITTDDVLAILRPIWQSKPETAARVRGRIEKILNVAKVRGLRSGENVAAWSGHLGLILPAKSKVRKVKHHAAMPHKDLPDFVAALREMPGVAAVALELTILTAARTGEVLGAKWSEFDLGAKVWSIPSERMKAGKPHRVPLSERAVELVESLRPHRRNDWLFPGAATGKPLSNMAMLMLLRRMKRGELTAHGFRSTFRDWCAEETSYPREVVEMALAHAIESKVEAAYRRGDLFERRRELMRDWSRFCGSRDV